MSVMRLRLPVREFIRALRIWRAVLTLIAYLWWDARPWTYPGGCTPERRAVRQQHRARWLTAELLSLGSAFIKLGQLLSARPDVLPAGWVEELADLQDKVPPFSFDRAQAVLEAELGRPLAGAPSIGDSERDLIAAETAGARPVLVLTGNGPATAETDAGKRAPCFADLAEAARHLIDTEAAGP